MLGLVEDDLQERHGPRRRRASSRRAPCSASPTRTGSRGGCRTAWRCWCPSGFVTTTDANGDILIYPEGDAAAPPSGRMPTDGYFFDTIVRQPPIDEDSLNLEDNLEEFGPISDADLEHFRREAARAAASGRGVIATFGGTAFGDIALVPAPFLKHPKGIRDIAEWYMSTATRRDYVHRHLRAPVRDRARQPGTHPRRGRRRDRRGLRLRHRFRHADLHVLLRADLRRALLPVLQARERLDPRPHDLEDLQALLRQRWRSSCRSSSRPGSTS